MPIKTISDVRRCPRLGHIRLGIKKVSEKSGKEYPAEVDYFILDPETGDQRRNEELKMQFKELYGEKPTAIKIMFPPVDPEIFFAQWFKRYGSGTLLKCKGDGETAVCALPEFAEGLEAIGKDEMGLTKIKCLGPECIYQKDNSCNRLGALQILLPDLSGIGVWQINTGSWNSIVNLNSAFDWLKGLCGRFAMIPITLRRIPTDIAYQGKKSKHYIMQVDLDNVNIAQLQQTALIAPEKAAIGMLPAPDENKDPLLCPETNGQKEEKKDPVEKVKETFGAHEAGNGKIITGSRSPLTVGEAVQKNKGDTFDVQGILSDYKTEKVPTKDKDTKREVTHYIISSEDNNDWMTVSKWGGCPEHIRIGDMVMFVLVKVSDYKGELKYLAANIDLIKETITS